MAKRNSLIIFGTDLEAREAGALAEETLDEGWIVRKKSILPPGSTTTDAPLKAWDKYVVVVDSLAQFRLMLPVLRYAGRAKEIKLVIRRTNRGEQVVLPAGYSRNRLGSFNIKRRGSLKRTIIVSFTGTRIVEVRRLLAAVVSGTLQTSGQLPGAGLRIGVTGIETAAWAAGDAWAGLVDDSLLQLEPDDIYPIDVIVGQTMPNTEDPYFPLVIESQGIRPDDELAWGTVMGPEGSEITGRLLSAPYSSSLPPVDTRVISPRGFKPYPSQSSTPLLLSKDGRLEIRVGQRVLCVLDRRAGFTENDIDDLRSYRVLEFDQLATHGPVEAARLLSQLTVAGVPTRTGPLHPVVRHLVGDFIADAMESCSDTLSVLERESWSIDVRRHAMDRFGSTEYWRKVPGASALTTGPKESVSVLLTTKRPEQVEFALAQMERQTWDETEVVLGLHGFGADRQIRDAVARFSRPIQVLELPGDLVFGAALNRVSHAASGSVITKVDDDDWYGENHLRDLMQARSHTGATLVGCQVEFVYLGFLDVTSRREPMGERFHDHVAGGSMTLRKEDLLSLGGWRPVRRAVDRCLLQAVEVKGASVYRMHGQGYLLQRRSGGAAAGHTWNPEEASLIRNEYDQFRGFVLPPQIAGLPGLGGSIREPRFASGLERWRARAVREQMA